MFGLINPLSNGRERSSPGLQCSELKYFYKWLLIRGFGQSRCLSRPEHVSVWGPGWSRALGPACRYWALRWASLCPALRFHWCAYSWRIMALLKPRSDNMTVSQGRADVQMRIADQRFKHPLLLLLLNGLNKAALCTLDYLFIFLPVRVVSVSGEPDSIWVPHHHQ